MGIVAHYPVTFRRAVGQRKYVVEDCVMATSKPETETDIQKLSELFYKWNNLGMGSRISDYAKRSRNSDQQYDCQPIGV